MSKFLLHLFHCALCGFLAPSCGLVLKFNSD